MAKIMEQIDIVNENKKCTILDPPAYNDEIELEVDVVNIGIWFRYAQIVYRISYPWWINLYFFIIAPAVIGI